MPCERGRCKCNCVPPGSLSLRATDSEMLSLSHEDVERGWGAEERRRGMFVMLIPEHLFSRTATKGELHGPFGLSAQLDGQPCVLPACRERLPPSSVPWLLT